MHGQVGWYHPSTLAVLTSKKFREKLGITLQKYDAEVSRVDFGY